MIRSTVLKKSPLYIIPFAIKYKAAPSNNREGARLSGVVNKSKAMRKSKKPYSLMMNIRVCKHT